MNSRCEPDSHYRKRLLGRINCLMSSPGTGAYPYEVAWSNPGARFRSTGQSVFGLCFRRHFLAVFSPHRRRNQLIREMPYGSCLTVLSVDNSCNRLPQSQNQLPYRNCLKHAPVSRALSSKDCLPGTSSPPVGSPPRNPTKAPPFSHFG